MKRTKLISLILSTAMLLSLVTVPAAAAEKETATAPAAASAPIDFPDMKDHWGAKAVDRWSGVGVLRGDQFGNFRPEDRMTRAEFATMLVNLMGYTVKAENIYADVSADAWYADAILKVTAAGVMQGDGTNATPEAPITRQEAAVMLCRALNLKPSDNVTTNFVDSGDIADWAKSAVAALAERGMVQGMGNNDFQPVRDINRASVAQMVSNMISSYVIEDGATVTGEQKGLVIVAADDVKIEDATLAEALIVAPKAVDATVTLAGGTKAADVVVAAEGAKVVVEKDASAASIALDAPKASAEVAGKADSIDANADDVAVTVDKDAAVKDVNVNGEGADVTVAGKVDNVTVADTAKDTDITVEQGATVDKVDNSAEGTSIDGKGKIANLASDKDVELAKDTTVSKIENTGDETIKVGGKEIKPDTSSSSTTPSGAGVSGGPTTSRANIVAANICDHAATGAIAAEDLGKVTVTSSKVSGKDKEYNVTLTGTNIMNHDNAENVAGHWVGFGMPAAPEGETYTYKVDGSVVASVASRTQETNGKTYNTVYFSYDTEAEFNAAERVVTVEDEAGETVMTYNVTFKVTFRSDYKVTVKADLEQETIDKYQTESASIAHKVAKGLGLTATVSGTTIKLTGETTLEKLRNTHLGTEESDGYLLFGINVGDKNIAKAKGTVLEDEKGGLDNALLLNVKIYDHTTSELLAKTAELELKDKADRTQGTAAVTVDATEVTIEGMKKVTFKAGDKVLKAVVAEAGNVEAPEIPASTDTVYYTGAWLNEANEVVDTFAVGESDNVTYTAQSVEVAAQTVAQRPANGPAGEETASFDYAAAYTKAGISGTTAVKVDGAKMIAEDAVASELIHNIGGTDYVFYGLQFTKPADATSVTVAETVAGLDEGNTFDLTADSTDDNGDVLNGEFVDYISVAKVEDDQVKLLPASVEFKYAFKWMKGDEIAAVTQVTITRQTIVPQVTVTFKGYNDVTIPVKVDYDTALTAGQIPAVPSKPGYTGEWGDTSGKVLGDKTINATYTAIEYTLKLDGTEQADKYTVEGSGIALENLTADEIVGWKAIGWMHGEELVEEDIPAAKLPDYANEENIIELIAVYGCDAEVSIVADTSEFSAWEGYPEGGFGTASVDEEYKVTGELKLVENFTGFNDKDEREQSGYYVAIEVKAPTGTEINSENPVIKVENGFAVVKEKLHKLSDDTLWLLVHVADKPADGEEAVVGATKVKITVNWKGVEDGENNFVCELDLSGLTLLAAADAGSED